MTIDKTLDIIARSREKFLALTADLSIEQLNKIPAGFNNNIVWNFAHLIATPQVLCYKLSGLPFTVEEAFVNRYRKETKPEGFVTAAEWEENKALYTLSQNRLIEDYKAGMLGFHTTYTSSYPCELSSIEDALQFSSVHDGMHIGVAIALKKLVN
jgi:hypothetical protein